MIDPKLEEIKEAQHKKWNENTPWVDYLNWLIKKVDVLQVERDTLKIGNTGLLKTNRALRNTINDWKYGRELLKDDIASLKKERDELKLSNNLHKAGSDKLILEIAGYKKHVKELKKDALFMSCYKEELEMKIEGLEGDSEQGQKALKAIRELIRCSK